MMVFNVMKEIETSAAPLPLGHYSQALVNAGIIYVSGQLPIDPNDDNVVFDTPEAQTLRTLQNLEAVVIASGGQKNTILKVTIFIADIALWPAVNKVYADFFGDHKPARSAVPVPALPKGFLVEIDAIAHIISI
jgi:2-iminobutanoate/2-iminopropanoate deaminase